MYVINKCQHGFPRGDPGLKSRMCPPYPHACRKRRLKWGRRFIAQVADTALSTNLSQHGFPQQSVLQSTPSSPAGPASQIKSSLVSAFKVLRPSGPNYWKNVEWIPYVFCKEYYSECQTNRVMGQNFGTITFCHL